MTNTHKPEWVERKAGCFCKDKGVIELVEEEERKARTDWLRSEIEKLEVSKKVESVTSHVQTPNEFIARNSECIGYNTALSDVQRLLTSSDKTK
jgi:hypothetical protein